MAVGAVGAFVFVASLVLAKVVAAIVGMRVHDEAEEIGLDLTVHGESGYGFEEPTNGHSVKASVVEEAYAAR
jgi:Amt family ammonium transporter